MSHEKLCVFCKNFVWESPSYTHYSTLTGGNMEGGISCKENKLGWRDELPEDEDAFRRVILTAQHCTSYTEAK